MCKSYEIAVSPVCGSCSHPGCEKLFAFKSNMMTHVRTHRVSSKSLQCQFDGCGRQFDHVCRLKQHLREHTGYRPHACPHCIWTFTTASKLQRHLLSHTGHRQWACPHEGCGKTFTRLEHVRGHMSTHSEQRPYSCSEPGDTLRISLIFSVTADRVHDCWFPLAYLLFLAFTSWLDFISCGWLI